MISKSFYILFLLSLVTMMACRNESPVKPGLAINQVKIKGVTGKSVSIPVHTSGILLSSEEMKLSFKTGGIVLKINAEEGKRVKKGDILATLNLSEINAQVSLARSGYEKASSSLSE